MKKTALFLVILVIIVLILQVIIVRTCSAPTSSRQYPPSVDTVTVHCTIRIDRPVPVREEVVRYVRVPIAERDTHQVTAPNTTTTAPDSLTLPVTQRVYQDTSYTAYVSGYLPALDSIRIHRPTHYIYIRSKAAPARRRRWSVGIQAGCGLTPRGLQPYIGVGVSYRLN